MTNIGIFDSGLGGLSVLNQLIKNHKANYFFLGDNKRVPYGNRNSKEIREFSKQIVSFLEKFNIDFYIIACNTIAVNAKEDLKKNFNKEFISITDMAIESLMRNEGDACVLATKATVESHYYKEKIEETSRKKIIEVKAQELVDFVEAGDFESEKLNASLKKYLKEANSKKIENIVLGCTHFPIIEKQIRNNLCYDANIIDPSVFLSENICFEENTRTNIEIYMTNVNPVTQKMANIIFDKEVKIKEAKLI